MKNDRNSQNKNEKKEFNQEKIKKI